jgi:hypothetical protein
MAKMLIQEHNSATGEIVEREMTADELAIHNADIARKQQEDAEKTAKAAEKAALLAQLGITDEQAKLLLS